MPRKLYMPAEVKEAISDHINNSVENAKDGYLSANEDEDTLTGHLGASLRIKNQKVKVEQSEIRGTWKWSIEYYKFRGRGANATEKYLGADGIFELHLNFGRRLEKKSMLFQAKKMWEEDKLILDQCIKMSTWREAAFLLNYTPVEFEAYFLDDAIRSRGTKSQSTSPNTLAGFLSEHFLECKIGDLDLDYDASSRKLYWRTISGELVATKFSIASRISVKIDVPNQKLTGDRKADRIISNEEIHNFRMHANEEDILSLKIDHTESELKKARKNLALTYHSDRLNVGDQLLQELLNRRMQEINKAYDDIYAKQQKKKK